MRMVSPGSTIGIRYRRRHSKQVPPKFTDRSFRDLIDIAFKDRIVTTLDHEIWDVLENGSDK